MNLLKAFRGLFAPAEGLVCPHCEKSLEGHDGAECSRKMSRRYFFGLGGAAMAAAVLSPALLKTEVVKALAESEAPAILVAKELPPPYDSKRQMRDWLARQENGVYSTAKRGSVNIQSFYAKSEILNGQLENNLRALHSAGFRIHMESTNVKLPDSFEFTQLVEG